MFLDLANFYQRFIQRFSKIAASVTLMLKTTTSPANIKTSLIATGNPIFLTPEAKLAFLQLRVAFTKASIKASILHHFDPRHYIRIETDASGYTI